MARFKTLIPLVFFLLNILCHGQNKTTNEIDALIATAKKNLTVDDSLALFKAEQAIEKSEQRGNNELKTTAVLIKANALLNLGNKTAFREYIIYARSIFSDEKIPRAAMSYYSVMAVYYNNEGKTDSCLQNVLKTITLAEKIKDTTQLISNYYKLQRIYTDLNNFKSALSYNSTAARLALITGDLEKAAQCYYSRAFILNNNKDHDSALYFLDKAFLIQKTRQDTVALSVILSNKAFTYSELGNLPKAIETSQFSLQLRKKTGNYLRITQGILDLAEFYNNFNKPIVALKYLDSSETYLRALNNNNLNILFHEIRSDAYFKNKEYEKAFNEFKLSVNLKDSLFSAESKEEIAGLQKDYEITSRQNRIELLDKTKKLKELELDKQEKKNFILILIVAFIFLLAIVLFLFLRNRIKTSKILAVQNEQINKQNTTLKKLNTQLIESEEELQNANEAKGQLLSIISHDISSPVKALFNFEESIVSNIDSLTNEQLKTAFQKLHKGTQDIFVMSTNLLDYAQTQQEGFIPESAEINLKSLTNDIVSLLESSLRLKQLTITNKIDVSAAIYSDTNLLYIIFRNIISNAIKFSPDGSTISIDWDEQNKTISFNDQGSGIGQQKIDLIMQGANFHSAKGTKGETGTGLGLKIVFACAQKINAAISIKSEIGKGTVLLVKL
ncbi:MAG: HAMP domain-containing histidine kinase [Bacteroidia bacterium]|nr:HAMP domain-containing histidine kinase [Bacteroidia bacterium]